MAWPNLRLNYHRLRGASLEEYLTGIIAQGAKAQGCTLDDTPPSAGHFTPDVIIRENEGGSPSVVVEIKKHPLTADISRLASAAAEMGASAVLLSDSDAPNDLKTFAQRQHVRIIEGYDRAAEVMAPLTEQE